MDQEVELEQLNEKLVSIFGRALTGQPRFRIVFSDGEREKRKGNFDIFGDNGYYLRTEYNTVKEVLKYATNRGRFILERYTLEPYGEWPANPPPQDVLNYNGYEPFYVFAWVEARPVPPWEALQFIIGTNMFQEVPLIELLKEYEEKKDEKYYAKAMDILDELSPYLPGMLHDGEAVVVPDMEGTKDE